MREPQRQRIDPPAVRTILCGQIDAALAALAGRVSDRDVHDARKCVKKARATLRLIREALPAKTYRRENRALRDAARPLSALRDARILLETLDRLPKDSGKRRRAGDFAAFERALVAEKARLRSRRSGPENAALARKRLRAARREVTRWRFTASGWPPLVKGLERVYARGRKAMKAACEEPTAELLHEWRKQVKYLWHQLQLIEKLAPGPIGELADQVHTLSDYLGEDHDFAVLQEKARDHAAAFRKSGTAPLRAMIARRQSALRSKAFVLGKRLYEPSPARFTARIERHSRPHR
jgi:CHAD domain-containing protein